MKNVLLTGIILGSLFLCGGCGIHEGNVNLEKTSKLRVGMTKTEVLSVMGEPVQGENYCEENRWYYYTTPRWFDFQVTEDECTPVLFGSDGKVIGWGSEFYARYRLERNAGKRR
ncbi:MAG: DUF3192 domain-containing protein [Victivallaceae bacterium]|nr:DUF3192 domain-containing protein [Victivallaceae bacterium]